MLIRQSMTNFKTTARNECAVSACSPLPLLIKALSHCQWWGESLWTGVHPPRRLLASEMKQAFVSTILACLLAFEQPNPTFGNNTPLLPPSSNPPMANLAFMSQHCFLPPSLTFKDSVDYTGPTWIIQENCPV